MSFLVFILLSILMVTLFWIILRRPLPVFVASAICIILMWLLFTPAVTT